MKKIIIALVLFLLVGCSSTSEVVSKKTTGKESNKVVSNKETKKDDEIDKIIESMSLEQKIAQMLVLECPVIPTNAEEYLKETPIGGIILMRECITSFEETKNYVSNFQKNSPYPVIISIDHEGGSVQRLGYLSDVSVSDIPFMYNVGKKNDSSLTHDIGKVLAEEVRAIGVNVDFAPDIDIFSNPRNKAIGKRSFGEDASLVSTMGVSLAKGLEDNNVISCFKHFPGHGDTDVDSHVSFPIINKSLDELNSLEFVPFKEVINAGAKMIMVGHIALPAITGDDTPSSLSKSVIDVLKNDLGYKGLVISDGLNMGALTKIYSNEEIAIKAVEAGNDLLLMPLDGVKTIEYIKNSSISEERINESVRKILKFKYKYLNNDNFLDGSYLNSEEHKQIINRVYN
ncbi:MAG: glycoside hydrolase family 3 protein [Bacilli bacterium]|nr:glycoside hydrolase family 3 protein [Bacilli bacterium]